MTQEIKTCDWYPGKEYQQLFDHMSNEHGLTLLQSEMDEIISISNSINKDQAVKEAVDVALRVACTKFDLQSNHIAIISCEEEVLKQLNIK